MPGLAAVALPARVPMMGVFMTHQPVDFLGGLATFSSERIIAPARRAHFWTRKKKCGKIWGLNGWISRLDKQAGGWS